MEHILRIVILAKPYYKTVLMLSLLILVGAVLQQAAPLLIKEIVNIIESQITTGQANVELLYQLIVLLFLSFLVNTVLTAVSNRMGDYASSRIGKYLVELFYRKILSLPQSFFDHELSGKIANQLTRGISSIADFLGAMTNFILPAIMQSVFTLVVLAYYSPLLGVLGIIIFPIYIWLSHLSTLAWGKHEVEKNRLEDEYKGRLQEVVTNIKLVKAANAQPLEFNFVQDKVASINSIYDTQSRTYHLYNFARNAFLELVLLLMAIWVIYATFTGIFTFGVLVLVIQLINQLRRPLFAMSFILERIQKAEAGSKEYVEILNIPESESIRATPKPLVPRFKNPVITFDRVSFKYDNETVLKNISCSIHPNETVAFVGHSGAGKTTLVNLLLKLYEPQSGSLYLNNISYNIITHQTWK